MSQSHLNLFSPAFRNRSIARSRFRQWSRLTIAAALGALMISYGPWSESLHLQALLHQCDVQAGRLGRMQRESVRMKGRLSTDRKLAASISECQDDGVLLRLMGVLGTVVRQMEADVRLRDVEFSRTLATVVPKPNEPKPAPVEVMNVTLFGVTSDQLTITQFLTRLRDTGVFETIEAKPMGSQGSGAQALHSFRIDGKLTRPRNVVAKG